MTRLSPRPASPRFGRRLLAVLGAWLALASAGHGDPTDYTGSGSCTDCHRDEAERWQRSHHAEAMRPATAATVLGNFNDASFEHFGVVSTFYRRGDDFYVRTDNAAGEREAFRIAYTFGVFPLQQYLIGFEDGRYQALSVSWDSRPADQGGQRWFHLYPDEPIPHTDPLHWTGAFQNWNSRCADCHSTGLVKNYDADQDSYRTSWQEVNVACEACHGPGAAHLRWAQGDRAAADKGLPPSLAAGGQWVKGQGPVARHQGGSTSRNQLDACGGCHSRRQMIAHPSSGTAYLDQYSPSLLLEGLYFPDGQIQDEVYVYGSFLQSKMHAAGVVCSNCHEPHDLSLRAEGNALCLQCHQGAVYDRREHHHHPVDSAGAQCVDCHMPERTYMVVDPRRDHSFRVPQPVLSELLGTPNACQNCHAERDNQWAQKTMARWYGHQPLRDEHASTLVIARSNDPAALEPLVALARDESQATILRATAIVESGRFSSPVMLQNAIEQLYADEALLRLGAVRALESLPANQRYQLLQPLIADPVKAVRMAIAGALAGVDSGALQSDQRQALEALFAEYLESLALSEDMPSAQLNLGLFHTARGEQQAAIDAYQRALMLVPQYVPALLNLADLYRAMQRDESAQPLLEQAIRYAPEQAPAYHSLGLLQVRQKQLSQALPNLERASLLDPGAARYSFVYGVALYSTGQVDKAIEVLSEAARQHPYDRQIQGALDAYQRQRENGEP